MPNDKESKGARPALPAIPGVPDPGGDFVASCDWGDNWARIALRNDVSGAEILVVIPFRAEEDAEPERISRQIYEQARPHLNKAVRTVSAKAWEGNA